MLESSLRNGQDLSSLRLAVTGAAPVPSELIRKMKAELGFDVVLTAYGLTETCGVVSICREGDSPELISRSSSRIAVMAKLKYSCFNNSWKCSSNRCW